MNDRTYPLTVTARSSGVDLDARPYAAYLLRDLLTTLADRPTLWDDLTDLIVGDAPKHDPHMPDQPSRDDRWIADVIAALPDGALSIRVEGPALSRLVGTLTSVVEQQAAARVVAFPQQHDGRWTA